MTINSSKEKIVVKRSACIFSLGTYEGCHKTLAFLRNALDNIETEYGPDAVLSFNVESDATLEVSVMAPFPIMIGV